MSGTAITLAFGAGLLATVNPCGFAPFVDRLAGGLLLISGLYLVAYWLPTLGDGAPASGGGVARRREQVSSALADFFAANTGLFAIGLAVLLVLGAALSLQRWASHRQPT